MARDVKVVPVSKLRPGDMLFTDLSGELDRVASYDSRWNSWRVQSRAFFSLWGAYAPDRFTLFEKVRGTLMADSHLIEVASSGPWRTRITTGGGAVVFMPRKTVVAVLRRGER